MHTKKVVVVIPFDSKVFVTSGHNIFTMSYGNDRRALAFTCIELTTCKKLSNDVSTIRYTDSKNNQIHILIDRAFYEVIVDGKRYL